MTTLDPVILFFLLGLLAGLLRSELRIPAPLYDFLSIYLLLSVGLKGGVELGKYPFPALAPRLLIVILLSMTLPLLAYPLLRFVGKLPRPDAASLAAHYGSVSVGTFAVAVSWLSIRQIPYESYMTLFLAVMEAPAIVTGVLLARGFGHSTRWRHVAHEIFLGKALVCLIGAMLIGALANPEGVASLQPFFVDLFRGMLALFLLEMGLLSAAQVKPLRRHGFFLILFGVLMPLAASVLGCAVGRLMGLSLGGTTLMAVLTASASYIAVPAAMRISVPEANPALSIGTSLGVTFPFNVTVGIPLYFHMAQWFHAHL